MTTTRPALTRGQECDHTEHAQANTYVGRYWEAGEIGGPGKWEPCPNRPSFGNWAQQEAKDAGDPDWATRTSWDPRPSKH